MLRALSSLLLLCALWLPVGSAWLAFAFNKHVISSEVKERIRQGVEESELVLLRIPLELEKILITLSNACTPASSGTRASCTTSCGRNCAAIPPGG